MNAASVCLFTSVLVVGAMSQAQSPIVYNAARGSLPSAQCFVDRGDPAQMNLVGGELHIGPTTVPSSAYFERNDFSIDFDAGFEAEAVFRVVSSTEVQLPGGPIRYGIQMSIVDDFGNTCAAQFGENSVALTNSPNDATSPANTAVAPYPLQGQVVVARVTADATQLRVFIDGALVVSLPRGPALTFSKNFFFGEGTASGSAELFVSYVRVNGSTPSCTPTSVSHVASGCAGLGTLAVSGILQPGQPSTQTFVVPVGTAPGVPLVLVGSYEMQTPYWSAGCRLGMDPVTMFFAFVESDAIAFPPGFPRGWPIAVQGARLFGAPGACSVPVTHQLTDICVVTL